MDLFAINKRRELPVAHYWELCTEHAASSLQLLDSTDRKTMQNRYAELCAAEEQFGFVFDAERLWLKDSLASSTQLSYADWLLQQLNAHVFVQPLLWGVFNDNNSHHDAKTQNVWTGYVANNVSDNFPWKIVENAPIISHEHGTHFNLSVYGALNKPNAAHLVLGFRRLFNLAYHVATIKSDLRFDTSDIAGYSIEVVNATNPKQWRLICSNEYGASEEVDFVDTTARHDIAQPSAIRQAYEADVFPEWLCSVRGRSASIPDRIVNKNSALLKEMFGTEYKEPVSTNAYLQTTNDHCACTDRLGFYYRFKWGRVDDFNEYQIGDEISWDGLTFGYPEINKVYVLAQPNDACPDCGTYAAETLICITNNRIESLTPDVLGSIQYRFHGPFVSDELISWYEYQKQWIDNAWQSLLKSTELPEFKLCKTIQWPETQNAITNEHINYLFLISKNRHAVPHALFVRSMSHVKVNALGAVPTSLQLNSQLKTCAVLHDVFEAKPCLIKFYWGTLLDFPEYKRGDAIRWSGYAIGDKDIQHKVYARGFIDGAHNVKVIVHIDNNKIVQVDYHADKTIVDAIEQNDRATSFYGDKWLPWMNLPDTEFIASRRPKKRSRFGF